VASLVVMMRRRLSRLALSILLAICALPGASPAGSSDTALVLSRGSDPAEIVQLTLADLASMPQVVLVTRNEFSDGPVSYRGPLVRDVLEHLALDEMETLRFTAANDYFVDIPTSDFRRYNAILAMEADGEALSRRDKGPLWLMYPISDHFELQGDPVYNARLIWQVVRIEAL
jgi:hypothetical protein